MCFFDDNDFDDCYNDVVAFLNSMTLGDWEKLRKDVEEELINDMCDDGDTFIFII